MGTVSLRPPTDADAEIIAALVCACDVAEYGEPDYDVGALREEWAEPGVELARDARLAVEPDGSVAAYSLLVDSAVRAWTHPARTGRGFGTAVREHAEARAADRGLHEIRQQVAGSNAAALAHLDAAGYVVRAHHRRMAVVLGPAHAGPVAVPEGVRVRPFVAGEDDDLVIELLTTAMAEVPGTRAGARVPDPALCFVAELDGRPAGALAGEVRSGHAGHVVELGVRRAARRRGIARALLEHAFVAFRAAGLERATLTVRTRNLAGVRLYEGVGMVADWVMVEATKPGSTDSRGV